MTSTPFSEPMRTSVVMLQLGAMNTGKTQGTLAMMADMHRKQGKPTLILDINSQQEYEDFQDMPLEHLERFNQVATKRRVPWFRCRIETETEIDLFFQLVHLYVKNAFVVFEDSSAYMDGNLSQAKKTLILNSRNACNDLLFNGHSLGDMAPFLLKHDDPANLPAKVPNRPLVKRAMEELHVENKRMYPNVKYKLAYRLLEPHAL
jgi:hypothetical protein